MSLFNCLSSLLPAIHSLNAEFGPVRVNRECEFIGGLVAGEKGRKIGKKIDDRTSNITIKL